MGRNVLAPDASLAGLLDSLHEGKLGKQLVYSTAMPSTPPRYGELDSPLAPALAGALARSGVERLWSHQAEGIAAVRRGENVLVTTPTASGKSLIFQIPALEEAAAGGPGRALFLFPLKALGQDQRGKFLRLAEEAGLPPEVAGCEIYDGDTPRALREAIRKNFPRVVISNPDMLHLGVLGHWIGWGPFLADVRWIVLDELHTYRGIFGSHFHHVLARFLRLCRAVGANPQIIASSATAANAAEFAETLTGAPFHWISESGAPREGRHLLLFRPNGSPYTAALQLFVTLVKAGMKTIVFTKARRITELLYSWLRRQEPDLARRVASYRAGFLPEERRQIERDLFNGVLDGVISTSALEMGVDVGGLDACILVGYPGSMMATWQRSGRVGRDGRASITAMVAMPDALDQYFLDHPQQFLERPCERLIVDPGNDQVARGHLLCAASELPLSREADRAYLSRHAALVGDLLREGKLAEAVDDRELHSTRRQPQRDINLRGSGKTFTIENLANGRVIGTVDGVRAYHECHPGAVYLHAGRQFLVEELRIEEHRVRAAPADVDYFTTPLTEKETEILEILKERKDGPLTARLGRLKVTERVVGFERKRIQGQEVIDRQPLDLPPSEFETVGLWWLAGKPIEETIARAGEHFMGSLHASEHAAISLVPTLALCDRNDLGGISMPFHPQVGCGTVFLYDGHPGGVGIMLRVFEDLPDLLGRVLALLDACPCDSGCPSCIQSPKCGNGNRPLDKLGAGRVLRLLLGMEEAVVVAEASPGDQSPGDELRRINPASPGANSPAEASVADAGTDRSKRPRRSRHAKPDSSGAIHSPGIYARVGPRTGDTLSSTGTSLPDAAVSLERTIASRSTPPAPSLGRVLLRWLRARFHRPAALPHGPRTILFDLETLRSAADVGGWHNCHRMGIAMGVVCHLEEDRFEVFRESEVEALADALRAADLVVGFNIKRFDYRVLAGYTGEDYERTLPTLDLLEEVKERLGFRLGMGHLAKETLGCDKSADGLQSLEWVRQGRLDLVEAYCRKDVEILRDLFLHGRKEGCVYYRSKGADAKLRLPVEW
jgi:DEAD/DEAH box helicase domain-containing protein